MSSQLSASAVAVPPSSAVAVGGPTAESPGPPRSFWRRASGDAFSRPGARLGAAWVVLLAFCGVFAPFIANTHPFLLKTNGQWSTPLFRHLTAGDAVLLAATGAAAWGYFGMRRQQPATRLLFVLGVVVVMIPLARLFVRPPITVNYSLYREAEQQGRVQFILRAPVPYSPTDYLRDLPDRRLSPPTKQHWMGTERDSADVLSRMIHAARIALTIGFISTGIAVAIGVVVGGLMGFYAGTADIIGMRLIEIFESIPTLVLLLTIVAVFERNIYLMMAIIGLTGWTGNARFVRAEFLRLRKQDFVQAAVAAGLPRRSVIFRHMLPNGVAPVLVSASFGVAAAILTESVLSFLGLGLVQEPSWGGMLNQARNEGGAFSWWMAIFPGAAIFLTVFAYNLIGESLRDALDPKLRKLD